MAVYQNVTGLIGNTPLVALNNYARAHNLSARLVAKVEFFNPAGSVKDRVALAMLDDAERSGKLKAGGTVVEPTSGNTGIGLACVAASRGYRVILIMPSTMSAERRALLKAYGAEIVLTDGAAGMSGAIKRAQEIVQTIPGAILAGQFENPANPEAHYRTTGPEIWRDAEGNVDAFVAGIGTGGTVSGVGRYLKERNPEIKIVGAEPATSAVLSGGAAGKHGLQGIGAGFVPKTLDRTVLDEIVTVTDEEAYCAGRELCRREGLFVGISSGAALVAAERLARRQEFAGKTIVVLFPDSGDRYLSTPLFT